ncbi:hypothetical protein L210DRAFT_1001782, partial [Boletus edulis BED1]
MISCMARWLCASSCPVYQHEAILASLLAAMTFSSLIDALKALRGRFQKGSASGHVLRSDHSTGAGILAVSKPVLAFSPWHCLPSPLGPQAQEPSTISTIYRNTSDAAQTFLPPVQAVADLIPGVGGIIKGAIGGMLSILQVVDVIRPRSL